MSISIDEATYYAKGMHPDVRTDNCACPDCDEPLCVVDFYDPGNEHAHDGFTLVMPPGEARVLAQMILNELDYSK